MFVHLLFYDTLTMKVASVKYFIVLHLIRIKSFYSTSLKRLSAIQSHIKQGIAPVNCKVVITANFVRLRVAVCQK